MLVIFDERLNLDSRSCLQWYLGEGGSLSGEIEKSKVSKLRYVRPLLCD